MKMILLGFFNVYTIKTFPYALLLHSMKGTADLVNLGIEIPCYPAVLSHRLKLSCGNIN